MGSVVSVGPVLERRPAILPFLRPRTVGRIAETLEARRLGRARWQCMLVRSVVRFARLRVPSSPDGRWSLRETLDYMPWLLPTPQPWC